MKELQLLQLNVERDKHWDRILPFLKAEAFDVVCLQELREEDAQRLQAELGLSLHFVPTTRHSGKIQGIGIFSKTLARDTRTHWYGGTEDIRDFVNGTEAEKRASQRYMIAVADIAHDDAAVTVATTHFPWTPDGSASDFQRESVQRLLNTLKAETGFVLCGDFNAPRGGEIWSTLAAHYRDNIPEQYTASLDPELHRAPLAEREKMVDGIFSTPEYEVKNVERVCGLSDHCGFTARVSFHTDVLH
jgi:endonuclease/exonuclease/phosphatase family metal-dependent hydrolase